MMRTTIAVDEDIYEAAQHLSRVSGERLGKVISKLARRGLERKNPSVPKGARRFPTFEVPAGAPIISASRIEGVLGWPWSRRKTQAVSRKPGAVLYSDF